MTTSLWQQRDEQWWLTDFSLVPGIRSHQRAMPGFWQIAPYETGEFSGSMATANPRAAAPEMRIPLPATGRFSVSLGLVENYCDRILVKREGDVFWDKLAHGAPDPEPSIQECWWKDIDLAPGDTLMLKQDAGMVRRCAVAYVRLTPAPPATTAEFPLLATMDAMVGNNGPLPLDEMAGEELQFADTHVCGLLHGTDINGTAAYSTQLPGHRYPFERYAEEVLTSDEYYPWMIEQYGKYAAAGRCPLDDSIAAAHSIGREFYAYHRMAITRLYAPFRLFEDPMFDAHPEWRCIDFDGTPITRLSVAFPEVRAYFLDHFRETIDRGADGLCLVLARGWPLVLFEEPVAAALKQRCGKDIKDVAPDDADLRQVRADFINGFMREIRQTADATAPGRNIKIAVLPLATPEINRFYGMDCETWAREGLVQMLCPYPYGLTAKYAAIEIPAWREVVADTSTLLCPIVNRAPDASGLALLERTEQWLREGVDGLSFWDLDSSLALPETRRFAYNIASAEGRDRLREIYATSPVRYAFKSMDGLAVDRYHPGWNV